MKAHEFIFGDALERTVQWIVADCLMGGTPEAGHQAIERLRGISRLIMIMEERQPGTYVDATLALSNETARLERLIENPLQLKAISEEGWRAVRREPA